jgi:hypothetical protein
MHNAASPALSESAGTRETTADLETLESHSTDESNVPSELEQQVEAAVRDVEDLLIQPEAELERQVEKEVLSKQVLEIPRENVPAPIDWSAPDLGVNSEPEVVVSESSYDSFSELDEEALEHSIGVNQARMTELAQTRAEMADLVLLSVESEARLRTAAAERRREEEEERLQFEESVSRRRLEDEDQLKAQLFHVHQAEAQALQLRDEEFHLRKNLERLNREAEELLQRKTQLEAETRTARIAAVRQSRDEAEQIHLESMARFHSEEESLRSATVVLGLRRNDLDAERQRHEVQIRQLEEEREQFFAEVAVRNAERERLRREMMDKVREEQELLLAEEAEQRRLSHELDQRRAELERARQAAQEDAKRVVDAWAMMKTAEESRNQAERERLVMEAEIFQRNDEEQQLLESTRRRAEEQRRLIEEGEQQRVREEERRISELEALQATMEEAARRRFEKEESLKQELDQLKLSEETALQRIQEFDIQRRRETEVHNQTIERLQRMEAEAKMRSAEESSRIVELEKRLKQEVERFDQLQQQHQARMQEESVWRAQAETRLQEQTNQYRLEQSLRMKAELLVNSEPDNSIESDVHVLRANAAMAPLVQTDLPSSAVELANVSEGNSGNAGPEHRAATVTALSDSGSDDAYELIVEAFDDESVIVRNAAARALYNLEPDKPAELFTRALKESSEERRTNIGIAISESGLADEAVNHLCSADREDTYNALCLLFTMAKTGQVDPLVQVIETHDEVEIRLAAVRLLTLSGQPELANAAVKRRLRVHQE